MPYWWAAVTINTDPQRLMHLPTRRPHRRASPVRQLLTAAAGIATICVLWALAQKLAHAVPRQNDIIAGQAADTSAHTESFPFSRWQSSKKRRERHQEAQPSEPYVEGRASRSFRLPSNTLAARTFVQHIDEKDHFLASPSILQLPSGRILVLFEKQPSWGVTDPSCRFKLVYASDDSGQSWRHIGSPGPMQWPQVFSCASGVYIIGCQRLFSADNNIVISRMVDGSEGAQWGAPVQLTHGLSVITINTGVDVSAGRVTKAFEMIPSLSAPRKASQLTAPARINISMGGDNPSWRAPPIVTLAVQDARGFIAHTLVKILHGEGQRALFFRVLAVDVAANSMQLRMERFTLFWQQGHVELRAGAQVEVGSNSNVYGGVDWVAMGMSADASGNLTDPAAWTFSNPLGNPASLYPAEVRALFDASFRADLLVQSSILGFDNNGGSFLEGQPKSVAFEAGFGSLYWMEGVTFRLQDRRGGSGKLLNLLRVNNDLFCDLAALATFDDTSRPGSLEAKFLRYKNVPGLAVGHPAVVYDNATDLYWMTSNINRDSLRRWKQPWQPAEPGGDNPVLHITPFSKCEVDRSTMGLYYSGNGFDWHTAGIVDYHLAFGRHFTYPHMTIAGEDLLVVMRASAETGRMQATANYYNNHNSNAVSFHRIQRFRQYANVEWATYTGEYTGMPRTYSSDET